MQYLPAGHFRHHGRFYLALLCGAVVAFVPIGNDPGFRIALGGITFFVIYLASTAWIARTITSADLRMKSSSEDEGITVIFFITLAAIVLSLVSLAKLLGDPEGARWHFLVAVANVPLGWATLHTVMAFHYAHLFYAQFEEPGREPRDVGGLDFPETKEPSVLDFIYYSFVVGMTAQVSDVQTTSRTMRRTTTIHGVVSFFFNTVILAFAVNVVTS